MFQKSPTILLLIVFSFSHVSSFSGPNPITLPWNDNLICAYPQARKLQLLHSPQNRKSFLPKMTKDLENPLISNKVRGILFDIDGTLFHSDPGKNCNVQFGSRHITDMPYFTVHFEVFKVS